MGIQTFCAGMFVSALIILVALATVSVPIQNFKIEATGKGYSFAFVESANPQIVLNVDRQGLYNMAQELNTTIIYYNSQFGSPVYYFVKNETVAWNYRP